MNQNLLRLTLAFFAWSLLGVTIGWYYTVTYFGRVGWPMPSVETVGALLLYYFSVLNVDTEIQAIHWLLVFPLAGYLWVAVLMLTAPSPRDFDRFTRASFLFGVASLPFVIPAPVVVWLAGYTHDGDWSSARLLNVALRRGHVPVWWWLTPAYLTCGTISFALHLFAFTKLYPNTKLRGAKHFAAASVVFVVAVALVGTLLSFPLRAWLE